jgi:hypothetical protein
MENNWHEKLFDFSSNPSYITITCVGIEPRTTGCNIIGYGVPFLSYYMRVLLIDLHKYGKPSVPQFDFNETRSETPARAPERVPVFQNAFH